MDDLLIGGPEKRFPRLGPKAQRGSKPRCHLLTDGPADIVARRLTEIAEPFATVDGQRDRWMPCGFDDVREATLPEADRLLAPPVRLELKRWWLTISTPVTRTPNWDIASTCTIDGKSAILLIEAKAHAQELIKEETGRKNIDVTMPMRGETSCASTGRCVMPVWRWQRRRVCHGPCRATGATRCRTGLLGRGS